MSGRIYEVAVCPFCGAPAEYEGGYEGHGWIFECEHESYGDEYGSVEPLKIAVELPGLAQALKNVAPDLEGQRRLRAREKAERREREERRRAALTPEQRQAEDERNAQTRKIFAEVFVAPLLAEMRRDIGRQVFEDSSTP